MRENETKNDNETIRCKPVHIENHERHFNLNIHTHTREKESASIQTNFSIVYITTTK